MTPGAPGYALGLMKPGPRWMPMKKENRVPYRMAKSPHLVPSAGGACSHRVAVCRQGRKICSVVSFGEAHEKKRR